MMKNLMNGDKKVSIIQIYLIKRSLYLNFSEVQRAVEFYFGCHFQYSVSPGNSTLSLNEIRQGAHLIKATLKAQDVLFLTDKLRRELRIIQELPTTTIEELGVFFRTTNEKLLFIERQIPSQYSRGLLKLNLVETIALSLTALATFYILK